MSEINEQAPQGRRNPLAWIAIIVVGLILFVFLGGDRRDARLPPAAVEEIPLVEEISVVEEIAVVEEIPVVEEESPTEGTIERSVILPPGMRAREYIAKIRTAGKPYPLQQVHEKAQSFQYEGSLADAHLLYFFAARENHLPAIVVMGQMSDPLLFQAENALLDEADAIQAFKWYSKADELGEPTATASIDNLRQWAQDAAATGNADAKQLLLNIQ